MGRACSEHSGRRILEVKPEGSRPLLRPRSRWNGNIKMASRERERERIGWYGMGCFGSGYGPVDRVHKSQQLFPNRRYINTFHNLVS
jgi:hypothetical protein